MPSATQLGSLVMGLGVGGVFGVYLSQTYEMPNMSKLLDQFSSWSRGHEKKDGTRENDSEKP